MSTRQCRRRRYGRPAVHEFTGTDPFAEHGNNRICGYQPRRDLFRIRPAETAIDSTGHTRARGGQKPPPGEGG
jgi:hypothetical protein